MTSNTKKICRRIAEKVANDLAEQDMWLIQMTDEQFSYFVNDLTHFIESTALPKMVTLLEKVRDMDDDSRHAAQGRGEIATAIDNFFIILQGDKPTKQTGARK